MSPGRGGRRPEALLDDGAPAPFAHSSSRRYSTLIKLLSLRLSVTSTAIPGIQDLNFWASPAFSLGEVGVAISAVEPFLNWRARWSLTEETQARLRRIRDESECYLGKSPADSKRFEGVDPYFRHGQEVWIDISRRRLDRRHPAQRAQ